jgi:hypothetical protein
MSNNDATELPVSSSVAINMGCRVPDIKAYAWPPGAPRALVSSDETQPTVEDTVTAVFRYLATRFPTLGFIPEFAVAELERRSGLKGWNVAVTEQRIVVTPPPQAEEGAIRNPLDRARELIREALSELAGVESTGALTVLLNIANGQLRAADGHIEQAIGHIAEQATASRYEPEPEE